ncbi:hypothetical protein DFJ67_6471 [Asanoa ferruginea]|uniref:Uncharacterized protein n=1 Tax=Asanoa ferruginea TaxID=53367 RepID=A0A3D9ZTD1_9ACTN|nr:hypothetical protein [Asanoa ferruginea]REG00418.1 hypothetical protein DFJ67_6471 [Asanoa ferruginea]GIF51010.1 hypothetical protein Afe04nite_55490 [Asanoa ferruginea]
MNVRQLAAVDMYGSIGVAWRRWLILGEFLLGLVGGLALGLYLILRGGPPGPVVFGVWVLGAGLNYLPLAVHALTLVAPGALERELTGVDLPATLRYYSVRQLWLVVPLLFLGLELARMIKGLRSSA